MLISITILYILATYLYVKISSLPSEKRLEFAQKALSFVTNHRILFTLNDVNAANNEIFMAVNDAQLHLYDKKNRELGLVHAARIGMHFSPHEILKWKIPLSFKPIDSVNITLNPLILQRFSKSASQNGEIDYQDILQIIRNKIKFLPAVFSKIIANNLHIKEVKIFTNNSLKNPVILKDFTVRSNSINPANRAIYAQYTILGNDFSIKNNIQCGANFLWHINHCNVNVDVENIANIAKYIGRILPNFPVQYGNIPAIKTVKFVLEMNTNSPTLLEKFAISGENQSLFWNKDAVHLDKFLIEGGMKRNRLSFGNFEVKMGQSRVSSVKNTSVNIVFSGNDIAMESDLRLEVNHANGLQIFAIWPEFFLPDVRNFLKNNIISAADAIVNLNIEDGAWNVKINAKEALFQIEDILPELLVKQVEIAIDERNTKIIGKTVNLHNKSTFARDVLVNIDYENDVIVGVKTAEIHGYIGEILNKLSAVCKKNDKISSVISVLNVGLSGKRCNDDKCIEFTANNADFKINLMAQDLYRDSQIDVQGFLDVHDVQYFKKEHNKSIFSLKKPGNSDTLQVKVNTAGKINAYLISQDIPGNNTVTIDIISRQNGTKFITNIAMSDEQFASSVVEVGKNTHGNVAINSDKNAYLRGKFEIMRGGSDLKLHLTSKDYNLQNLWHNDIDFSEIPRNRSKLDGVNLDIDIQNVLLPHAVKIDKMKFRNVIVNKKLTELQLDAVLSDGNGGKTNARIFSINNGNKYEVNIDSLDGILRIFGVSEDLYVKNLTGTISTSPDANMLEFAIDTGKIIVNIPISDGGNEFKYKNTKLLGSFFWYDDTRIFNISHFEAKGDVSKITSQGFVNFADNYINIYGKINSAYIINRILTMEDVPILHKIITLDSKNGGIGTVQFAIKGKFSELSQQSIKIGGDKSNLTPAAGVMLFVNPLLAVPLLIMSKGVNGN